MRVMAIFLLLLLSLSCSDSYGLTIQWFGHATFLLESSQGTKILTDPLGEETGYALPQVIPDIITISHEHFDHNYVRPYKDIPKVIRGLSPDAKEWQNINETIKDVKMYTVPTYHDKREGKDRGKNSIFVFLIDELRLAHLGDLGHTLTPEQIKAVGELDVLLIPTGGVFTIDPWEATEVIKQLNPRIVIPMHFRTQDCSFNIYSIKPFVKDKTNVRRVEGNTLKLEKGSLPEGTEIVILGYK